MSVKDVLSLSLSSLGSAGLIYFSRDPLIPLAPTALGDISLRTIIILFAYWFFSFQWLEWVSFETPKQEKISGGRWKVLKLCTCISISYLGWTLPRPPNSSFVCNHQMKRFISPFLTWHSSLFQNASNCMKRGKD